MGVTLYREQRDAMYELARDELMDFEALLQAIQRGDLETAYRLGRKFSDNLQLIMDGLGRGERRDVPVEFSIPAPELRSILVRLRDRASSLYESERPNQEEVQIREQTGLVRDTCDELVPELDLQFISSEFQHQSGSTLQPKFSRGPQTQSLHS